MQSHFDANLPGIPSVLSILDRFAKYKLPIQITEFDIDILDEESQAAYTRDFYTAIFSHPATDKIIMWGFWEGDQWRPNGAMIRTDWSYKPNYYAFVDLIFNEWWTDKDGRSTRDGLYQTRGFLGDYEISASFDGHRVSKNVSLEKDGATVNIQIPTTETGIDGAGDAPVEYGLQQNYPNPFNASTVIEFTPEHTGDAELAVYDARGVQVFSKKLNVIQDVRYREDVSFAYLATGTYYYSLVFQGGAYSGRKMMLVK